ncbi:hypothetical protein TIFTF001_023609 [Ficus carica]|uniref:Uncharacterized protein n=1 Tax=Ficus carica TaxID=3494 RepID=A0AA88AJX4_FICCA|nr:hypothetical protein TIFTF001_023609 [Ficus carica]
MPVALFGLISCLALWDVFKFCSEKWGLDRYPVTRECVVRLSQCVGAVILMYSNVQMALFCALGISYAGHDCFIVRVWNPKTGASGAGMPGERDGRNFKIAADREFLAC